MATALIGSNGMNRTYKLLLTAIFLVLLLLLESYILHRAAMPEETATVYRLARPVSKGAQLRALDIETFEIRKADVCADWVTTDTSVARMYARHALDATSILQRTDVAGDLSEIIRPAEDRDRRRITLKLQPDQANGWMIETDQQLELLLVKDGGQMTTFDVVVVSVLDDRMRMLPDAERSVVPEYVCLELSKETAYALLRERKNGRFELVVK